MSLPWCCQTVSASLLPATNLAAGSVEGWVPAEEDVGYHPEAQQVTPLVVHQILLAVLDEGPWWSVPGYFQSLTCRYQMSSKIRVLNSNYWVWSAVCLDRHSFTNINNLKKNNMVMVSFERCWMMMGEVPTHSDTLGLCSVQSSGPGCGKGEGGPEKRLYGHPPHPVSLLRC